MAKYDLTSSLETTFTFSIEGKEFVFRKPTVREMRALAKQFAQIEQEENQEVAAQKSDEAMRGLYQFITPVDHDANIEDLISNQPINVQVAFNEMVKTELGAN